MKTSLFILILLSLFVLKSKGQSLFQLTDTIFQVGQVFRADITFDLSGKPQIHERSFGIMDSIINFLNSNENISIEFDCHSDYKGDTAYFKRLTEYEAKVIMEWCIVVGKIDSRRISYKGYGEYRPVIVDNEIRTQYPFLKLGQVLDEKYIKSLGEKDQEFANKLNRRTEVIITKTN